MKSIAYVVVLLVALGTAFDTLAQKFPDKLEIQTTPLSGGFAADETPPAPQPKLAPKGDDPSGVAKSVSAELQMAQPPRASFREVLLAEIDAVDVGKPAGAIVDVAQP